MDVQTKNKTSQAPDSTATCKQRIVRVKFYLYVEMCESGLQSENHIKRLTNLRKELNFVKNTDWQYDPIEKFIGQS